MTGKTIKSLWIGSSTSISGDRTILDPQENDLKNGVIPGTKNWGKEPESQWGILHTEIDGEVIRRKEETIPGNYSAYYNNIADCLRKDAKPIVPAQENLKLIMWQP